MRWWWILCAGCAVEPASTCPVGDLSESHYCGDDGASCQHLDELSQGCIGSHTEQDCVLDGTTYVSVGGGGDADLYFDDAGVMVAVRRIGEGADDACPDAWFGLDLSACELQGDEVRVECDGNAYGE